MDAGIALSSLQYWIRKSAGRNLSKFDFQDAPCGPHRCPNRTTPQLEAAVLRWRRRLTVGDLGECGAAAIARALAEHLPSHAHLPCIRTIHRILERHGAIEARQRIRRPPPPRGWYLPALAARRAELDCFDGIDALALRGGRTLEVFTGISHWGGLPAAWPVDTLTTDFVLRCLRLHWSTFGLPTYVQFDNDTIFSGAHHFADTFSRVVRFCLQLKVVPVFSPPQETGFQAQIESFNARWQRSVWQRFTHRGLAAVCQRNTAFLTALRARLKVRLDAAPQRRLWPQDDFVFRPSFLPPGKIIFLRRTNEAGQAIVLGRSYAVDANWQAKLVRAELDLSKNTLRFYALRRRAPSHQPLLKKAIYQPHDPQEPHSPATPDTTAQRLKITAKNR